MSHKRADDARRRRGFPRVSGDEPMRYARELMIDRFSPRERG